MNTTHPNPSVKFYALVSGDIPELNDTDTLYTIDFRAISESMEYKIPAMFKYENLLAWIVDGYVTANRMAQEIQFSRQPNVVEVDMPDDPRVSIYSRLKSYKDTKRFNKIFVGIPHPDADAFARESGLVINYSYHDFIHLNDKIKQKELFFDKTPKWKIFVTSMDDADIAGKYLKRQMGSGGYTIYSPEEVKSVIHGLDKTHSWYIEDYCPGTSCSAQIYKASPQEYTVFGFTEQIIEDGKHFSGAKLKNLSCLTSDQKEELTTIIKNCHSLLERYRGFFGIDFIIKPSGEISALELNVRMTAMSVPTMIFNESDADEMLFREDVEYDGVSGKVIAVAADGLVDILGESN